MVKLRKYEGLWLYDLLHVQLISTFFINKEENYELV
jgi:hypothetical protein